MDELWVAVKARYPVIWLETFEEVRAMRAIQAFCEENKKDLFAWSVTKGLQAVLGNLPEDPATEDPEIAISRFMDTENGGILAMHDLHGILEQNPRLIRCLRETAQALRTSQKTIIVTAPVASMPGDLEKDVEIITFDLPAETTMLEIVAKHVSDLKTVKKVVDAGAEVVVSAGEAELARGLLGLTADEAKTALASAATRRGIVNDKVDTPMEYVLQAKKRIVSRSGALEYLEPPATDYFRGYELLRAYLMKLRRAFLPEARAYGLDLPKGVLLVSPPGCGKSLISRLIGRLWNQPVIRLDLGALFGGLVGESEANARRAIQLAEAVAPCVLQLDEIEKGFSGTRGGETDGGTTARVFASFLTWMQEKTAPVFVMATANDIGALPPELLRKGRFDELFVMDLPTAKERAAIFAAHLEKRGREVEAFDVAGLARLSDGFSGAEIEQTIKEALLDAFSEEREVTRADVEAAIRRTVPLLQTMAEQIGAIREWGRTRARPASAREEKAQAVAQIEL